jgi:hypothetical protein
MYQGCLKIQWRDHHLLSPLDLEVEGRLQETTTVFHRLSRGSMRRYLLRLLDCRNGRRLVRLVMEGHRTFIHLDLRPRLDFSSRGCHLDLGVLLEVKCRLLGLGWVRRDFRRRVSSKVRRGMLGGEKVEKKLRVIQARKGTAEEGSDGGF